jgi:hypothetical protein
LAGSLRFTREAVKQVRGATKSASFKLARPHEALRFT